jgi:hypothetical protein
MWGVFAGITVFIVLVQMIEEARLRHEDKKRLADMRKNFSMKKRWDVLRGRSMSD